MRTTIELSDETRAALLAIAASRGLRGFSTIVEEAVQRYVRDERQRDEKLRALLGAAGTWTNQEATEVRARIGEVKEGWTSP